MQENIKSLVATSVAHFANDGNLYVFITLYPRLFPLGSEGLLVGTLAGLQSLFSVVASPFVGRIADRKGNFSFLLPLGLSLMGVGIIGYSILPIFASGFTLFLYLVPFAIVGGAGSSFYHPLGGAVLHQKWQHGSIGRAMGLNGSIGSFGRALFPILVVSLVVYFQVPSVTALAIFAFAASAFVAYLLHSVKFAARPKTKQGNESTVPIRKIISPIFTLTIVAFLREMFAFGIVIFIPNYLTSITKFGYSIGLGLSFSLILGMSIAGQPVFGYLADHIGRRLALGISIAGASASILILLNVNNEIADVALLASFGFFIFTGFPLVLPLANSIAVEGSGTMSGSIVWGIGDSSGATVGPILVGLLATYIFPGSLRSAYYVMALLVLASLAILPTVPKPRPKRT